MWYILVGGEASECQGVKADDREFLHTSLQFIGTAYEALRTIGVPREKIITIVQLQVECSCEALLRRFHGQFCSPTRTT
jgi:hypothetical protein